MRGVTYEDRNGVYEEPSIQEPRLRDLRYALHY